MIELLEWDSGFFGYCVAKLNVNGFSINDLSNIREECILKKIRLLYLFVPQTQVANLEKEIAASKGVLADKKVTYHKNITQNHPHSGQIDIRAYSADISIQKMIDLSLQSGEFSRFRVDKNFMNAEYERLYTEWMYAAIVKRTAFEVLVALADNNVAGMITLSKKGVRGEIGLLAVDAGFRGRGIGKKLIEESESLFLQHDFHNIQVVSQLDNKPACKLYESCGYKLQDITYVYHLWF